MLGDRLGFHSVLDGRAPLPRGVLALLEPRGALRRDRGAHREHPHRLRRAAAAEAVQPSDPHRRVGRGARPDLRRPRRVRHRSLVDARRARGLRRRPARDARDVERGARTTSSARGPTSTTRPTASTGRWARRAACSRSRCRRRTRRSGARRAASTATTRSARTASACCRSPSACRPRSSAERLANYRERPGRVRASRSASSATSRRRRSRWCTARHQRAGRAGRRGVVRLVREARRARCIGSVAELLEGQGPRQLRSTRRRRSRCEREGLFDHLTFDYLRDSRLGGRRRPRPVHRGCQALRGGRLRAAVLPGQPVQDPARRGDASRSSCSASTSSPSSPNRADGNCRRRARPRRGPAEDVRGARPHGRQALDRDATRLRTDVVPHVDLPKQTTRTLHASTGALPLSSIPIQRTIGAALAVPRASSTP